MTKTQIFGCLLAALIALTFSMSELPIYAALAFVSLFEGRPIAPIAAAILAVLLLISISALVVWLSSIINRKVR